MISADEEREKKHIEKKHMKNGMKNSMKMGMIRTVVYCVLLLCFVVSAVGALEFEEILRLAVEHDGQIEILSKIVENKRLATRRSNLDPTFSLAFDLPKNNKTNLTGARVIQYFETDDRDPYTQISAVPELTLTMPHPALTSIVADSELFFEISKDSDDATHFESYLVPSISLRQPLSALFGLEPSKEPAELQNLYALEKAMLDLYTREIDVRREAVRLLRECVVLQRSIEQAERDLEDAQNELEKQRTLRTYGEESYKFKRLQYSVDRYTRDVDLATRKMTRKLFEFSRLIDTEVDSIPEEFPRVELLVDDDAPMSPSLYLSELSLRMARVGLAKEKEKTPPNFYVGGGDEAALDFQEYATEPDSRVTHKVVGNLGARFEDFSLSADVAGNLTNKQLTAGVLFSYDLPDNRSRNLKIEERENDLEIAALRHEAAKDAHFDALLSLSLSITDLENRAEGLVEAIDLAKREYEENITWNKQGLVSNDVLKQSEWNYLKTLYDERLLLLDRYRTKLEIAKLSLHERLNED